MDRIVEKIFNVRLRRCDDDKYEVVAVTGKRLNDLPFMYIVDREPKVFLNETKSNNCLVLKIGAELLYINTGDTLSPTNAIVLVKTIEDCNVKITEMKKELDLNILIPYIV